jgi:hypothetical protein
MRANPVARLVRLEISRFPCKERAYMPGSPTTPGRPSARVGALRRLAFRYTDSVGTRGQFSIAAQWLACTYPCRRFANTLTDAYARLGADVVRYSFIAGDLHPLLLAGLPAHLCENPSFRRTGEDFSHQRFNLSSWMTSAFHSSPARQCLKGFCSHRGHTGERFHTASVGSRHWRLAPVGRGCVETSVRLIAVGAEAFRAAT